MDTSGQERFRTITSPYYTAAHGIMFVYDVNSRTSFEELQEFFSNAESYADEKVVKILVGNKQDSSLDRAVSVDEAKVFQVRCSLETDNNSRNSLHQLDVSILK